MTVTKQTFAEGKMTVELSQTGFEVGGGMVVMVLHVCILTPSPSSPHPLFRKKLMTTALGLFLLLSGEEKREGRREERRRNDLLFSSNDNYYYFFIYSAVVGGESVKSGVWVLQKPSDTFAIEIVCGCGCVV